MTCAALLGFFANIVFIFKRNVTIFITLLNLVGNTGDVTFRFVNRIFLVN